MAIRYEVDTGWMVVAKDMGLAMQDVLRHAQMPLDLFSRKNPTITADEYFRIWRGLQTVMRDDPLFALKLGQTITPEAFSPPIFACFCSENLNVALTRLAHYKPLVGPLKLDVTQTHQQTTVIFKGLSDTADLPYMLITSELVFFVQIARLATRERIVPLAIFTMLDIPQKEAYADYFGVNITKADFDGIRFSAQDANRPFMTASDRMWSIFEPELNLRMQDLEQEATFTERVRACLMEILASGQYSMSDVASRLAVSTRTLQRRLRAEDTSFQKELDSLREELARNYLTRSDYSSGQIAFLLGYEDPNSFFRAFRSWTGETPEVVRASVQ